jgi:hypothetical protein
MPLTVWVVDVAVSMRFTIPRTQTRKPYKQKVREFKELHPTFTRQPAIATMLLAPLISFEPNDLSRGEIYSN